MNRKALHPENIRLTVIVACYNEELMVEMFYRTVVRYVKKYDYRFIFIDDGSKDETLSILQKLSNEDPLVAYISLSRNFGQPNALKAGYDFATDADCVISMDADLQHPPDKIDLLVAKWQDGFDIVNTVRAVQMDGALNRRIFAKLFYRFVNIISTTQILADGPDYRLVDRKVVSALAEFKESTPYLKEIIPWMGFNCTAVPVNIESRSYGESKYSFLKLISLSLRGITSFSVSPLRLSSFVGVGLSFMSFLYGIYAIYVHLFTDQTVQGWTSIIASVLFISGIQMLMLGIIGEYLGKTFLASKRRPAYLVKEIRDVSFSRSVEHKPELRTTRPVAS
ncbi:glycosyltransferase family 2 protein [Chitinophaga sp. GCM10012297]|uniref:Glycosyltransferase family 2 protein n=1 Tax=Chitinophaga chungangae TaxID=2821488 RepID=A0ABS3YBY6_9BACT|nr:glycosyltransferase family 2 protein [Chitinophaga chungangae]MBO9152192.1 glycosyltransferase family 2 protein [Chitinophaga chungangae]